MIITAISPAINRIRFRFFLSSVPFLSSNLFIRSFLSSALVLPMVKSYTASPFYRLAVMSCISLYGPVERLSNRTSLCTYEKRSPQTDSALVLLIYHFFFSSCRRFRLQWQGLRLQELLHKHRSGCYRRS